MYTLDNSQVQLIFPDNSGQFYSNSAEILAILPAHGLIILTKFDEDHTKLVD